MKSVSQSLLSDSQYDIEFHGYLSNHAKHGIIALDRLGASEDRIQEWWDGYTTLTPYSLRLHRTERWDSPTLQPCSKEEFFQWKGEKIHWQSMVLFLQKELESNERFDHDINKLVEAYAPPLLSGIAGALMHGIIHLGWAIDAGNEWMILEGLAYLQFCHLGIDESLWQTQDAPDDAQSNPLQSITEISRRWKAENLQETWISSVKNKYDESFHPELVAAGFQWHLSKTLHEPHSIVTTLPTWLTDTSIPIKGLWEPLYRLATTLYLVTRDSHNNGNFLVLHLLTSLWGLECVLRVVQDDAVSRRALQQYYSVMVCTLATSSGGFPSADTLEAFDIRSEDADDKDLDWTPMEARGIAEEEEHNIKLVYVCRELWKRYGRWRGFSEAAQCFVLTPNIGSSSTTRAFKA